VFDSLTEHVSGSPWTYAFLLAVSAIDVIIPLVPSETSVILAGVLASTGDLVLVLVILFAAAGAILGDNIAYWIGRKTGHRIVNRFFKGERRKQVDWAHRQVEQRGGYLIVIGRFIPGGRTAVTLSCGMLEMPWRRFIAFVGGRTFEEDPLKGFLLAFVVALLVAGVVEAVRWYKRRRVVADS
jgi:membrane-associated protein